ncbi:MAG: entericidin A/B family lipoprotein [Nitrosomonadales bacterium]|nr:entericidin A/B family lipoprotein [Nitrosomonadales bacterium]
MRVMALVVAALMLVGCNTFVGLGKDIKKGGEKLEKAATK